jgi:hypothetical protein
LHIKQKASEEAIFTAFGNFIAPLENGALTSALGGVCSENGTRAVANVALAGTNVVQAVLVELLGIHKQMAIGEDLIAQLSANLFRLCLGSDVYLAWMRNNFIVQKITGIFCLPFVGERMDGRLDIA